MRKIVVPFQRGEDLMKTVGQLYVDLNKAKDVLLDMEKVRGLIYRESLASCKDLSLEEALRAADGPRFGGTAPVDLLTELRPYEGGPEHFTLNTMDCRKSDMQLGMMRAEDIRDVVRLWIFSSAPESISNTVQGVQSVEREVLYPGPRAGFAGRKRRPAYVQPHPYYYMLGDPEQVEVEKAPLLFVLDALFTPGIPAEKRVQLLRRSPLNLTSQEEDFVIEHIKEVEGILRRMETCRKHLARQSAG